VFCFVVLPVAPAYSEIVLDKNAPGVGVVKPSEWMKDYFENKLKDAAFGSEVDAGMDTIFQKTYDKFISANDTDRSLRRCKGAAFTQAYNVAGELHNARVLRGFGEMFWDIEKNLVTLGGGTIAEFLQKKTEEQIRKAIRKATKNQKTVVYENSYSFDGGEQHVKAVWNKSAGTYTIFFTGNSHCKEVRDRWINGRKIRLAEWTVVARGSAKVVPNKNKTGLRVIASRPRLSISANCNCTSDGTRIPPPPPPEEDDETEEDDEDKVEDPIKLGLEEGNVFKDALQCPACKDKHAELERLARQTRSLAGEMNRLAKAINDEPYKTKQRDMDHADWLKNRSKLLDTQEKFNKLYVAYVKCEENECKKTGPISLPIRDSRSS
ncbi:MAG: hypothetical protein MI673_03380, partial [Thiotrichales bacterium]|nr:hypothetical protein [Thiotrichales bacterium]